MGRSNRGDKSSGKSPTTPASNLESAGVPQLDLKGSAMRADSGLGGHALFNTARSGRKTTNRDVDQKKDSIFVMNPEEWNNVPKIVYDAVIALV